MRIENWACVKRDLFRCRNRLTTSAINRKEHYNKRYNTSIIKYYTPNLKQESSSSESFPPNLA